MNHGPKSVLAAGLWMTAVQFVQNQLLFLGLWQSLFEDHGQTFTTAPVNGVLWTVWSLLHAYIVREFLVVRSLKLAVLGAWCVSFPMMWCALYNLQALPLRLLLAAVPISLGATFVSAQIILRLDPMLLSAKAR
jgi:hypothetical protein